MPPFVPPPSRNSHIPAERPRPTPPTTSQASERPQRGGPPSAISNQDAAKVSINGDTFGRSGGRTIGGARRRLTRAATGSGAAEADLRPGSDGESDGKPLIVHPTDPHQQYTRSNIWQQIFSMLHDAASKVFDMGQKVVDLAHRGMEIITTRIS